MTKALSMAEGIEKFAKLSSVRVIRKNGITEINVDDLTKKEGSLSKDIELEPGDVVYVPKGF
ncbi:MAG: hypothetical protein M5U26_12410 [Planctomycetota bacterium]|nr:hypothetical protein [Planctomycetota bacterium]